MAQELLDDGWVLDDREHLHAATAPAAGEDNTVPWTTVYLGKRKLGDTPLVDVVIPAGEVELLLVNPEFDIRQPYLVKAKAGARLRKKLKLD